MGKNVMLITLQTFSTTGGIQKMTRTLGHSLFELAKLNNWRFKLWSAYDKDEDLMKNYLPQQNFKGFANNRAYFVLKTLSTALRQDVVILSHINLASVGLVIKLLKPSCSVWLIAHGIEVWRPLSPTKKLFLKHCDKLVCVSHFTKQQMTVRHQTPGAKCFVLNNAVDPFMKLPELFDRPKFLMERYSLKAHHSIIFTLTRLTSSEQYKGYEQVIKAVSKLKSQFPDIKYLLSGQYDTMEQTRITNLITACGVEEQVILTGFIDETELSDHFLLADLFVLPSKKEGFGIVFIEALACGLPVICGNADGSVDAICNGKLGKAIEPDNLCEIEESITESLQHPLTIEKRKYFQQQCLLNFNEQDYMVRLKKLLTNG